MKIDLPLCGFGGKPFAVVEAELLDIAPHLAGVATFAVHHSPTQGWMPWRVSNIETGFRICGADSRSAVIAGAREILAGKTEHDIAQAYRMARREGVR